MTIKIRSIPFVFDVVQFRTDVMATAQELGLALTDVDNLAGVSIGSTGRVTRTLEENMHLQTLINICNALDLDPRKYLVLK